MRTKLSIRSAHEEETNNVECYQALNEEAWIPAYDFKEINFWGEFSNELVKEGLLKRGKENL